jgi:GAF domain-containing protein
MPPGQARRAAEAQDAYRELAAITLSDHSVESVMDKVASLAKQTIANADDVSVTLRGNGESTSVAFTGRLSLALDERQYEKGYGPCIAAVDGGEIMHIEDMNDEQRWPDWAAEAVAQGAGSSLSLPLPVQREVGAAINIYSTKRHAFDAASIEVASTFAAYAGVALANMHSYEGQAHVAEQLQAAMKSRAVIEQAKGIVMAQRGCDAEAAFDVLVQLSQASNRKLRDIAEVMVAAVAGDVSR